MSSASSPAAGTALSAARLIDASHHSTRRRVLLGLAGAAASATPALSAAPVAADTDAALIVLAGRFSAAAEAWKAAVLEKQRAAETMAAMVGPTPSALIARGLARKSDRALLVAEVGPDLEPIYEPSGPERLVYCPDRARRQIPFVLAGQDRIAFLEKVVRLGEERAAAIARAQEAVHWGDRIESVFQCDQAMTRLAFEVGNMPATSPAGIRAKARVAMALADTGLQRHAKVVVALSLAEDAAAALGGSV